MTDGRFLPAVILLTLIAATSAARASDGLHPSLRELEGWLGEWHEVTLSGEPTLVEYRAALDGRFIEAWHRHPTNGGLRSHSMIGADPDGGVLTEYRFDDHGRMTVDRLDTQAGPTDRPVPSRRDSRPATPLHPSLDVLAPFLGQWEVMTDWLDGSVLWAQMSNYAELGGKVVCSRILAAQGKVAPYDRYRTFYYQDETESLREITFTYKGAVVREQFSAKRAAGGAILTSVYSPGSMASVGIRKELRIVSERTMHWADYFQDETVKGWEKVIDANWIRIGAADPLQRTMAIDDALFVNSGSDLRPVTVERSMDATPKQVWKAWTTEAGWTAAYAAGRAEVRANIELAPGGKYEWLFDGALGCNGCQVLSYLPYRMLSFTWNAPVAQPRSRVKRTWIVIEIKPERNGKSRVRATQLGFGAGSDWDETRSYFEQAWAYVLDQMAGSFARQKGLDTADVSAN